MGIVLASRAERGGAGGSVGFNHNLAARKVTVLAVCLMLAAMNVVLLTGCNGIVTTTPGAANGSGSGGDSTAPVITTQPGSETVAVGQAAAVVVVSSGRAPLRYQWQKNDP